MDLFGLVTNNQTNKQPGDPIALDQCEKAVFCNRNAFKLHVIKEDQWTQICIGSNSSKAETFLKLNTNEHLLRLDVKYFPFFPIKVLTFLPSRYQTTHKKDKVANKSTLYEILLQHLKVDVESQINKSLG